MIRSILLLLAASRLFGLTENATYVLDVGAHQVTLTNSGPVGGVKRIDLPNPGSGRILIWFSTAGYPETDQVASLATTNTGTSGCTSVQATWPNHGSATATLSGGAVTGWTITNPGNDYGTVAPTVTTSSAGCSTTPAATATLVSRTSCSSPCSLSMNLEYGSIKYWYEVADASGNRLNPRKLSGKVIGPYVQQACKTAPFTVPVAVAGFENVQPCWTVNIPNGASVSSLRAWLWVSNLRNGAAAL